MGRGLRAGMKERKAGAAGVAPWHRRAGEQVNQGDRGEARGQEGVPPRPHRSQAAVLHRGGSAPQGTLAVAGDAWLSQMGEEDVTGGKSEKPCPSGDPAEPRCPLASPPQTWDARAAPPPGTGTGDGPEPERAGPSAELRCRPLQGAACYSVPAPSTAGSGPRNGERGEPNCTNGFVISRNGVFVHTSKRLAGVEASSWGLPEARLACQLRGRGPPR